MSEFILAALALLYAGWIGHGVGKKAGLRDGVKLLAGNIDPSHLLFANAILEGCRKVHDARMFAGPGPQIHNEGDWTIRGLGRFKITVEEWETEDA